MFGVQTVHIIGYYVFTPSKRVCASSDGLHKKVINNHSRFLSRLLPHILIRYDTQIIVIYAPSCIRTARNMLTICTPLHILPNVELGHFWYFADEA